MKKIILGAAILASSTLVNAHTLYGGVEINLSEGMNATYNCGSAYSQKCISYGGLNVLYPGKEVIIHFPGGDQKGVIISAQSGQPNDDGTTNEPTDVTFISIEQ